MGNYSCSFLNDLFNQFTTLISKGCLYGCEHLRPPGIIREAFHYHVSFAKLNQIHLLLLEYALLHYIKNGCKGLNHYELGVVEE